MIYRNECPLCHGINRKLVCKDGVGFTEEQVWLCLDCSAVYLDPYRDNLNEFYRSNDFSKEFREGEMPTADKLAKNYVRALNRWLWLKDYLQESSSLLEIGCSSGEFLDLASNTMLDVRGIDLSTSYADFAGEKGHDVQVAAFPDEYEHTGRVDCVASFHTLEHIPDPHAFIEKIRNILPTGGLLAIEYPDLLEAMMRRGDQFSRASYFQKSHLVDFNKNSLVLFMARKGFQAVVWTGYDGYPLDKNILVIFQKMVDENTTVDYDTDAMKETVAIMAEMLL